MAFRPVREQGIVLRSPYRSEDRNAKQGYGQAIGKIPDLDPDSAETGGSARIGARWQPGRLQGSHGSVLMRLVDTSAWIEALIGSPVGGLVAADLPGRADWLVPTIVQHELVKWLRREAGEAKADEVIAFSGTCIVASLNTAIAVSAAELCVRHRLASADAIIYATALAYGADLLTCDQHFDGLHGVRLVPKSPD
jgi:predicted nucleic acid-binding protein